MQKSSFPLLLSLPYSLALAHKYEEHRRKRKMAYLEYGAGATGEATYNGATNNKL